MSYLSDPESREIATIHQLCDIEDLDVLEIGCGEGKTARALGQTARSVLGVDLDEASIVKARQTLPCPETTRFEALDIATATWPPESFDRILLTRTL